ncbi:MAG: helix-turn-helix transcriptional regulator [Chromatium okenii]|uniref:XRE family transcriptional regulator n=2 Tax=Chromatium okenii TaxID=61644 RepID=A0A2S7XMB8_9GAMM|nr:helix-turn-helix transcriptional regulator [Chromatium okenii]PQJ94796.1 XRE family transcriptional regulator [Chromatium okenii]
MLNIKLKEARKAAGLTQNEVATALGFGQSFLSKLERGDKRPNVELLSKMAALYGVTESSLIGTVETNQPIQQSLINDDFVPAGLRELSQDKALVVALAISSEEWRTLLTLNVSGVSKSGYIQLLTTIRGVSKQ